MTHRAWAALALLSLLSAPEAVCAEGARDDVMDADRAFAARSAEAGAQTAFQEVLAPDGVLFRPTAVNGPQWLDTHEEASGRLDWSPATAGVSCDGALAVTLGPWAYRQDTARGAGFYLTVWRRSEEGAWQVAVDHAIAAGTGAATGVPALPAPWSEADERACARDAATPSLAAADDMLNAAIGRQGIDAALQSVRSPAAVVLRDGHVPAPAAKDWPADVASLGERLQAVTQGSYSGPGSDLGYSFGELWQGGQREAARPSQAVFVRVWARAGAGWQLLVDMLTPLPANAQ